MATDYGTDCDGYLDIPRIHNTATGSRNVGNAIARRLQTPFGALSLIGGDPTYGFDVRSLFNSELSAPAVAAAESAIQRQCELDERVDTSDVRIDYNFGTSKLKITIKLGLVDGEEFDFILSVSRLTVEILEA